MQEIRSVSRGEAARLSATITLAMSADPTTRWAAPDASQYVGVMMPCVLAFGGTAALEHETAFVIGDFLGAAVWLPPGVGFDEATLDRVFSQHIEESRLGQLNELFEKMASHHPQEPHWYLPLIGVDPAYQRRGLGSRLMEHALAKCDADGVLAYLEATSLENVPLYERHGFKVVAEITAGSSPPMFPMIRRPC
jgi:GNAT superfamily N-acetyltransferase